MRKIFIALLTVCLALSAGFTVATAAGMPKPERTNVLKGLSEDAVTVTDAEGNEASLIGGPHGGSGSKSTFIDGVISSTATSTIAVDGRGVIGYVTIDAGADYVVDRVLVDLCHDWGGQNLVIELSLTADFANPVTIYDNRSGSEYTADPSVEVKSVLYNRPSAGTTFNFQPVKARYIRVTDNTVGNGRAQGYTTIGEIQMFAVSGVPYVYTDTTGQVADGTAKLYATEEGAEIYYTTDGSVPTDDSLRYVDGIEVNGTAKVRAIAYKDGKHGAPIDFVFTGSKQFISKNAALGKSVKAYHPDGSEATVSNHNGGQTIDCVVDGIMNASNSIVTDGAAFIQVDMGESVWINKAILNLWHDHVNRAITVQLSDDETFAAGVQTIFCSDNQNWAGAGLSAYVGTLDETWADKTNVEWIGGHTGDKGFEFNFEPIKGRYIRALAQDQTGAFIYTELQAWTCEEPNGSGGDEDYDYKQYLSSVEDVADIEVYVGKDFAELGLPQTIKLGYSDGTDKTVETAWISESYDKTQAGEYFATLNVTDEKDVYGLIGAVNVKITVKALNTTALAELYDGVKDLAGENYTVSTRANFVAARTSAKELLDKAYKTQAEVDAAYATLKAAVDKLVDKGDVTALKRLIDGLNVEEESKYTVSSYAAYTEKKLVAEAAVADGGNDDLNQADVDKIADELEKAVNGLVKRADPSSLKAAYDAAKEAQGYGETSTNGYNRATYAAYMDAMYNAERFFDEEYLKDVPQSAADEAEAKLAAAIAGLVKIADRKPLDDIATKIKNAKAEDYTATSYAALMKVYEEAKPVIDKADDLITEEEVTETAAELNEAFGKLVALGDKKQLNAAIGNCAGEEAGVYTTVSYAAYRKALYEAEKVKASDDVSQAEVDAAAKALEDAYNALEKLGDKTLLNDLIAKAEALTDLTGDKKDNVEKALAYAKSIAEFDGEVTEKQVTEAKELLEKAMADNAATSGCSGSLDAATAALAVFMAIAVVAIIMKKRVKDENV